MEEERPAHGLITIDVPTKALDPRLKRLDQYYFSQGNSTAPGLNFKSNTSIFATGDLGDDIIRGEAELACDYDTCKCDIEGFQNFGADDTPFNFKSGKIELNQFE